MRSYRLTEKRGKQYYNNNAVISSPLSDALVAFNDFLKLLRKPCILVAPNAPFDTRNLIPSNVSEGMLKKNTNAGISCDMLSEASKRKGALMQLLAERDEMNQPRVIKNKKIIDKIISFFNSHDSKKK
nr:PREDICTED: uncharacterized protein LOC105271620 [Fopius arisanus]